VVVLKTEQKKEKKSKEDENMLIREGIMDTIPTKDQLKN